MSTTGASEAVKMSRIRVRAIAAAVCLLLLWSMPSGAQTERAPTAGHVTTVIDGDTLDVRLSTGREVRVRIFGIDCPERGQPFANVALRYTRSLVFDRTVQLTPMDRDRYGRLVAKVEVDGEDVAEALVRAGLAWQYVRYSDDPRIRAIEAEARAARRGVWQQMTERPASARGIAATAPLHGNVQSRVYHRPSCRNYTCKNCLAVFDSPGAAEAAGYRAAGDCHRR